MPGRGQDDPHRVRQDQDEGDPDYFFFKTVKQDMMCKAISAIDSVYNRTMALELTLELKGLSDELEEDEDLHNKLKCDQVTSYEQITADNAKFSTQETSISGENARAARLTEEITTLEKDIAASKSAFASQSGEALDVLKQLLEEMNSGIVAAEAAELEHKKAFDELSAEKNEEIAARPQQHKVRS